MNITFFGYLWILLLVVAYFKGPKMMIYVLLFSMVLQCDNVFEIGNIGVGPGIVTSLAFIIYYFLGNMIRLQSKRYIVSQQKYVYITLSLFLFYILISDIVRGHFGAHFLNIAQLFAYLICACLLYRNRHVLKANEIDSFLRGMTIFLVVVGVIQILITSHILPRFEIVSQLLYNDTGRYVYYHHSRQYIRVLSTYLEPSFFSTLLVGLIYYFLYRYQYIKNAGIILWIMICELILTFSSTGYVIFAVFGVIYVVLVRQTKVIARLLPLVLIVCLYLIFVDSSIIDSVILNKYESSSGMERNKWNELAMEMFIRNPIYGVGYKEIRASSMLLSLMAELGIIGVSLYGLFFLAQNIALINRSKLKKVNCESATKMMMICCIMGQFVACPDLELCTFWQILYLNSLSIGK